MRTFSFGGGRQSMAVLVLAAQGRVQYDDFLFSNVGDDSEHPATLAYVRDVAQPFADANGLKLITLQRTRRDGSIETLRERLFTEKRSISIPARLGSGAPGNRSCTGNFKINVIARWLKRNGATKDNPAVTGLGISLDEFHRARTDSGIAWQTLEYPLIDLRLTVADCIRLVTEAGLPVPPKSSCYFCPFHKKSEWARMRREEPELFRASVEIEEHINTKRGALGKDRVWLHSSLGPLDQVTPDQPLLPGMADGGEDECDTGYCFV